MPDHLLLASLFFTIAIGLCMGFLVGMRAATEPSRTHVMSDDSRGI